MPPDTTDFDDDIAELKDDIRNSRIAFWLLLAGVVVSLAIESGLIMLAVSDGRTTGDNVWIPFSVVGGFAAIGAAGACLSGATAFRDQIIADRQTLRRWEEDRKTLLAGKGNSRLVRLNRYKNDLPELVESYRLTAKRYRRRYNALQSVVIFGSLGASAIVGLLGDHVAGRITAVMASASVAIAATYSGFFRYREKSIGLQATADAIEQEHRALQLGIGAYSGMSGIDALTAFATKVESLRSDQQRLAVELDQAVQLEYQVGPNQDLQ
jgi:hypothetical protein